MSLEKFRQIVPGIYTWPSFAERFGYDFNGFLVEDAAGNLAIDPVELSQEILAELARRGVARIVLTNRNHFRDAEKLRLATGAKVSVHPADAAFVREKGVLVDEELIIGQTLGPFVIIDAHGKSPGEIALHIPSRRLLLVGDACVGKSPGVLGLLPDKVIDDKKALQNSLARIAQLDFDTLLLADGHSILSGGRAAMQELVATI